MNTDLTSLKPALVWKHFAAMTQIPRPSFHEEKIRRYVLDVARWGWVPRGCGAQRLRAQTRLERA